MSFRTVVISNQSKLNYKNRFLVVKQDNDEKYIHLSEIDTIIVDSIAVSISSYLLKELSDSKINIIFCDEKHNPFGELSSYYSSHNTSKKIQKQINWSKENKDLIWQSIIKNKIINQALMLHKIKSDKYELLLSYIEDVLASDKTNREGHAAKVYFNELFGKDFVRNDSDNINAALNYGYAILLSTINKEVISNGYLTQIGIHHKNEFNEFNLSCDLMEPFRIIIDNFVYFNQDRELNTQYKLDIINIFNNRYNYENKNYVLKDIIKMYVKNTLESIEKPENYKELKQKAEKRHKNYPSLCRDYIYGQPWFQKSWMCDSGISGMMEMLDSLYDKLLNVSASEKLNMESIVFLLNYLDVNARSYDHIFLKMKKRLLLGLILLKKRRKLIFTRVVLLLRI